MKRESERVRCRGFCLQKLTGVSEPDRVAWWPDTEWRAGEVTGCHSVHGQETYIRHQPQWNIGNIHRQCLLFTVPPCPMFAKLVTLACVFTLSVGTPLPGISRDATSLSRPPVFKRNNEGPRTDADGYRCTQHYTVRPGDTCTSISIAFGLPPATLIHMNPEIGDDCAALGVGKQYCVQTIVSGNPGRSLVLNGLQ
ncbi:hypothetical protein DFH07DRAFT_990269 [Mycena maculata]|uniref:LysM domain-containing protein n=1 Tax=Mycena maculata TaxID=230809 RepID=A0AAD7JX12_9AGAR|nr:hypothetical protein DFH07DRAFT_990269 [Mycena maculata]